MKAITPETSQKIIHLLQSGNYEDVELGLSLARSQNLDPYIGCLRLVEIARLFALAFFVKSPHQYINIENLPPLSLYEILSEMPQLASWIDWGWPGAPPYRYRFVEMAVDEVWQTEFASYQEWVHFAQSRDFQERLRLPLDLVRNKQEYEEDVYMAGDLEPFRQQCDLSQWHFICGWSAAAPYHEHLFAFFGQINP
ncbi:MAG: hypothetical protein OHK0053_21910 [Microscillaceae bacterium]